MLSVPYVRSTVTSTWALGHAGSVRSIRWAPYPHEVLASVGHDGLLLIWDPALPVPMLQHHDIPYTWSLDLAWSPIAPLVFVAVDDTELHLQSTNRDYVPTRPKRALSQAEGHAVVWAIALSSHGDRLACGTSGGRLELLTEKKKYKKYFSEFDACVQITSGHGGEQSGASMAGAGTAPALELTVTLGSAARPPLCPAAGSPLPPSWVALRCLAWNPNAGRESWLACGTSSGLLLLLDLGDD